MPTNLNNRPEGQIQPLNMNIDTKPTEQSFLFVIEDGSGNRYDAFMDLNGEYDDVGGYGYIDLRYKAVTSTGDKWTLLDTCDVIDVTTTEKVRMGEDRAIAQFNAKIKDFFGEMSSEIPTSGYDRVFWTLKNGLKEVDNVISRI